VILERGIKLDEYKLHMNRAAFWRGRAREMVNKAANGSDRILYVQIMSAAKCIERAKVAEHEATQALTAALKSAAEG